MLSRLSAILLVMGLAGCAQIPETAKQTEMGNLLVPEPAPVSIRSQVAIARFEQILSNVQLTDSDKAQIHFQRLAPPLFSPGAISSSGEVQPVLRAPGSNGLNRKRLPEVCRWLKT